MQPRTLALLVIILPLLASNGAYLLSAFEGSVTWCVPYLEGCTTISRAGRSGNSIFLYRVLVFAYGLLLMCFWIYSKSWLELLSEQSTNVAQIILWLGLIGAFALLIYIDFLGAEGEFNRFMRRLGALFYFACTPLAQFLLLKRHYVLLRRKTDVSVVLKVLNFQRTVLMLLILIVTISGFFVITDQNTYERENIVEWNYSLLLILYFSGMVFIWEDYRQAFTIGTIKGKFVSGLDAVTTANKTD